MMAKEPTAKGMPLMYQEIQPLSSVEHANWKIRQGSEASFISKIHAIPLLVEEFVGAQRFFPIVFSQGEKAIPLALMGLNEGVNVFVDDKGALLNPTYVPAYMRRYPFMLARLDQNSENLSLCFDPTSGLVGEFDEGLPLFEDGKPSETVNGILKFCEEFEISAQRTTAFMEDLEKSGLLIDGEIAIQLNDQTQPVIYRGFRIVDETKFRELPGKDLLKYNKSGMLPLMIAHMFSLSLSRDLYLRQLEQGKGPQPVPLEASASAEA
jgi:hypothetical protein